MKNKSGTSFRELVIHYYIQKLFPDAENRFKHEYVGELDVYIPSINVAVEYDGSWWHKDKLIIDNEKNARAKEENIRLIRIREYGLPATEGTYGEIYLPKNTHYSYDVIYLNQTFSKLGEIIGNPNLAQFCINEDDYKAELPKIYSIIYDEPVESSLADMCGIELWDRDFNGELNPANIPSKEWAYATLRCKNGRSIELPRYHREFKGLCKSEREDICKDCVPGIVCPLIRWCHGKDQQVIDCPVVDKAVYQMIEQGINYNHLELSSYLRDWMWKKSTLGIRLINEVMDLKKNDPVRRKYYRFFGIKSDENDKGIISGTVFVRNEDEKRLLEKFAEELIYTKLSIQIFSS